MRSTFLNLMIGDMNDILAIIVSIVRGRRSYEDVSRKELGEAWGFGFYLRDHRIDARSRR